MKYISILLTFIMLTACETPSSHTPYKGNEQRQSAVNAVRKKAAIRICKQAGLHPFGSGGQTSNGVEMLALSFQYYKPIDIDEGRRLLIDSVNTFVQIVNSDENIQPYIKNPPFGPKNIEITIFLSNPDQTDFAPRSLCCISAINAVLDYDIHDLQTSRLTTIYRETYEEALVKITQNTSAHLSTHTIDQVATP